MKKFDVYKAISKTAIVRSPVLKCLFRNLSDCFPQTCEVLFYESMEGAFLGLRIPKVTTPTQFEKWLFRTVTRTEFKGYKVEDNRYIFDFEQVPLDIALILFNSVLKANNSKSWLEPLQEIILDKRQYKAPSKKSLSSISYDWGMGDMSPEEIKYKIPDPLPPSPIPVPKKEVKVNQFADLAVKHWVYLQFKA